jgi:hypothetical protein
VRLAVVTVFGLIGNVSTAFLGMALFAEADAPISRTPWTSRSCPCSSRGRPSIR